MPIRDSLIDALRPYFAGLRFDSKRGASNEPIAAAIVGAHKVYLRPDLIFDDGAAIDTLSKQGITHFLASVSNQIISTSSHIFVPADTTYPVLVSFKFHSEHNGKAPCDTIDCMLKPLASLPLELGNPKAAWIELLPEVQVLRPEHPDTALFQSMLLKHCNDQGLLFCDPKVDYRKERKDVLHNKSYGNESFPERSNIGLIPAIKDREAIKDTDGNIIMVPIIIDSGAVVPPEYMKNIVPNLVRKDLTFAAGFRSLTGYEYTEVGERNKHAPSLTDYLSQRAGKHVELSYEEAIRNYTDVVLAMKKSITNSREHHR